MRFHAAGVLFASSILVWACGGDGASVELPTVPVEQGTLDVTLTASGELEAINSVKVNAPGGFGRRKIVELVDEGSIVNEGDLLVSFETKEMEDEVLSLEDQIITARAKLDKERTTLEGRLADLERGVQSARLSLEKIELGVTESEAVARIERERARLSVEEAKLSLQKAEQDLDAARKTGDANLRGIESELAQLNRRLSRVKDSLAESEIYAPTDGLVILATDWRGNRISKGDEVWGGRDLLELPDLSAMRVAAYVHEMDAAQVTEGQQVEIRLDAYQDKVFRGNVEKKASIATQRYKESKVKTFRVEVALEETTPEMKPGMTVRCDFEIGRSEDVLYVPREAVVDTDEGPVLYIKKGRGVDTVAVSRGVMNATHVAVTAVGDRQVEVGMNVYLGDPTAKTKEGRRDPQSSGGNGRGRS